MFVFSFAADTATIEVLFRNPDVRFDDVSSFETINEQFAEKAEGSNENSMHGVVIQ